MTNFNFSWLNGIQTMICFLYTLLYYIAVSGEWVGALRAASEENTLGYNLTLSRNIALSLWRDSRDLRE
jgi:hypothetical protein